MPASSPRIYCFSLLLAVCGLAHGENLRIINPMDSSQAVQLSGVWCNSGDPSSKSYSLVSMTTPPTFTKLGCYQTDDSNQVLVLMPASGSIKKIPYSKVQVIDNVSGKAAYTSEFLTQTDRDILSRKQSLAFQKPVSADAIQNQDSRNPDLTQSKQQPTAYEEAVIKQMQYQNLQNNIQQITAPKIISPLPSYTNQNQSPFSQAPQQPIQNPTVNCRPNGSGGFICQ
jgi:hypothetical protein